MTARLFALVAFSLASIAIADTPASRPVAPDFDGFARGDVEFPASHATTQLSAREIARRIKEARDKEKDQPKVAFFDLKRPIIEKPAEFALFGEGLELPLRVLVDRLNKAKEDAEIKAVLINFGNTSFNLAQAQEIRDTLAAVTKAGKKTFVYADGYDTPAYIAASGASDICILGGGEMEMPGVHLETMFAKGLLDKIGVQADYIQIGEFKGADEQFTRTEASKELKGELNKLVDAIYAEIVDGIAKHRNLKNEDVKGAIDQAILTAKDAKDRKLVDHLLDQDGLRDLLGKELGHEVNLVADYGAPPKEKLDLSNPFSLFALLAKKSDHDDDRPAVAVVYAEGVITDGEGGDSLFGGSIVGSDDIRKAMRMASRDADVKAIVIRIDSPGGSALASEVMWQAVRRVAKDKPIIISVGSMAASGGYYLASAGDYIFADSSAIVGSIGVVGGKFVMKDLFGNIGLNTETFTRGKNADLFSSEKPFDEGQRKMVTAWMKQTYDQFTERVMSTRKGKIKDIDAVARGRIFAAPQALELGMVDKLGGVEDAIAYAAGKADLRKGAYQVKVVPPTKTLADLLTGDNVEEKLPFQPKTALGEGTILKALSPSNARLFGQQLQMLQLLQRRPVLLMSPYVIGVQ